MRSVTFIMLLALALADASYKGDIGSEETSAELRENDYSAENDDTLSDNDSVDDLPRLDEYDYYAVHFLRVSFPFIKRYTKEEAKHYQQCVKKGNEVLCLTLSFFELEDDEYVFQEDEHISNDIKNEDDLDLNGSAPTDENVPEDQDSQLDSESDFQALDSEFDEEEEQCVNPDPDRNAPEEQRVNPDPDGNAPEEQRVDPDPDGNATEEQRVNPDPDGNATEEQRVNPDPDGNAPEEQKPISDQESTSGGELNLPDEEEDSTPREEIKLSE